MVKLLKKGTQVINVRYGILGAMFMGSWVYYLNMDHPFPGPLTAALKQAAYTFFVGGFITKLVEFIVKREAKRFFIILWAILASTAITAILMIVLHSMKGTPAKAETILWTILVAPPGFIIVAIRERLLWEKRRKVRVN